MGIICVHFSNVATSFDCPTTYGCSKGFILAEMQVDDIRPFVDTSTEPLAPLYGRADHAPRGPVQLSAGERFALALRAIYLLLVFAPFMTVGVFLLLLSNYVLGGAAGAQVRNVAYRLLLFACRASGAAFIKWGQWASSRPDMLPEVRIADAGAAQVQAEYPALAAVRTVAAFSRLLSTIAVFSQTSLYALPDLINTALRPYCRCCLHPLVSGLAVVTVQSVAKGA